MASSTERRRGGNAAPAAQGGFTLLELILVVSVMALLAGTMAPLVIATQRATSVESVEAELDAIAQALDRHYFEHGTFPATLDAPTFRGVLLLPGVGDDRLRDEWGARAEYRLSRTADPDVITVYSVGEDGRDDGPAAEVFKIGVYGAKAGGERTRQRLRIIVAALATHLDAGGRIVGTWSTDRAAMGLGPEYQLDGFGLPFVLDPATMAVRSAGADRRHGTADDIGI